MIKGSSIVARILGEIFLGIKLGGRKALFFFQGFVSSKRIQSNLFLLLQNYNVNIS